MGVTCQLVRVGCADLPAVRTMPFGVLDVIDWDHPTDRWVDLDQAWSHLMTAFETDEVLVGALRPGDPVFDESEAGGQVVMLAEPDLVRSVADALDEFQRVELPSSWRERWRREPGVDAGYLEMNLDLLRQFYRRAEAAGEAVAVVIG